MTNVIFLPWPPSILSPNARAHWAIKSKAAKAYRSLCGWHTKSENVVIDWEGTVHMWITFYPPDRRHRDDDNCVSSWKSGRDGVADALGINDKRFRIHPWLSTEVVKDGAVRVSFTNGPEGGQ